MNDFPLQPRDESGPVFNAPWEAQAFGLVVALHEAGAFTWPEWADYLSKAIADAQAAGDADLGDSYYAHWLAALERIASDKNLTNSTELSARRDAWHSAYLQTPHGQPIQLIDELGSVG